MSTISILEAKDRLVELLHEVEAGEIVVLTRDGEPIAQLGPVVGPRQARKPSAKLLDEIAARAKARATPREDSTRLLREMRDEAS
jgi:antitoxin (DNA-binding transcriptional repressor) of toxin-antitoxin stability system